MLVWLRLLCSSAMAQNASLAYADPLSSEPQGWTAYFDPGQWVAKEGALAAGGPSSVSARLSPVAPVADAIVEVEVRVGPEGRRNLGIVLAAQDDRSCLVVRHYDTLGGLELLRYTQGNVQPVPGGVKTPLEPGRWYTMKVAAADELLLAKIWPTGADEPDWQWRDRQSGRPAGRIGLVVDDGSQVAFRNFRVSAGPALTKLQAELVAQREAHAKRLRESLRIEVTPTPFVLRDEKSPKRRLLLRTLLDGQLERIDGTLAIRAGQREQTVAVEATAFGPDGFAFLLGEPTEPTELQFTLSPSAGGRIEHRLKLRPARHWRIYMNPHTHYDIGFTDPQPVVIERLSSDMDRAVEYVNQTADYPPESRYRWTVEVTGLMKNYVDRHRPAEVDRFMELVRQGRIEICGFYLNMPTEMVGHEELIRCLYDAEHLRRTYGIPIDTAQINDVPGYTWALPQLLGEFGIRRVSLRANSIRGQFLWFRPGAIPRPFYWQGPNGSKLFTWYTDTYRDGCFFREPGLHENEFAEVIRRNEATGYPFDYVQLRIGGDNLPPDLDTSTNARAFNEKYLWPRVIVSTNREFLEPLERDYGPKCQTRAGDIPSWWADGPGSAAAETGVVRLLHDRLVSAEGLWTALSLTDPSVSYPVERIHAAYDKMLHFDEHTWGASCSITEPNSDQTRSQWAFKAAFAQDAKRLTDQLVADAVVELGRRIPAEDKHAVAVWNPLGWTRTDAVELALEGSPLAGSKAVRVVDTRDGKPVASQISSDGKAACFVGRDLPPVGYAVYTVEPAEPANAPTPAAQPGTLENRFYRLVVDAERAGWTSWFDRELGRELLDAKAEHLGNQPIHERSLDGRAAIDEKRPTRFARTTPTGGKLLEQTDGPVYQELVVGTSLPGVPEIRQAVRLYHELKIVDVRNLLAKEEVFEPEGVYFAFPFDVPKPDIWFQIADGAMQAGRQQLKYSCQDFYAIQQWAEVSNDRFGVLLAPLEAPILSAGGLNAYRWADQIDFGKGHLYSWVMNNYWTCNFRAGQSGTVPLRYRLSSHAGGHDPVRATRLAWQPFYPPMPVWLPPAGKADAAPPSKPAAVAPASLVAVEGDSVLVSCLKRAEEGQSVIVRLLEMHGKASQCALRWSLPPGRRVTAACLADCVERPGPPLSVTGNTISVPLRPHQIVTVRVDVR